ncbi:hypothetical protein D3C80_1487980 [compost metagenome]
MRRGAFQPLDDQRRNGIQKRRAQCQANAQQVFLTTALPRTMGADDGQHAEERHAKPCKLGQCDLFAQKQRCQPHQHERLHVVHRCPDGDRRTGIRGKQQQPVADNGHAAGDRQQERRTADDSGPQKAESGANHQQGHGAENAAPEHHLEHRLPRHQHEPADGPGNQHGGDHFQRATAQ